MRVSIKVFSFCLACILALGLFALPARAQSTSGEGSDFSAKGVITMDSLPEELQSIGRVANLRRFLREQGLLTEDGAAPMARIEAELIRSALEQNHFILLHTARMLHIDRKTLCRKIRQNPWLKELADKEAAENS